jgi:hypothetical protein
MGEQIRKFTAWFFAFSLLSITGNSIAGVFKDKEEFKARLLETSPGTFRAMKLVISIESYTSFEEVSQLIETYKEKGYKQFRRAFHRMKKGYVRPTGGHGVRIILHAAQSTQTESGRRILVAAEGYSWKQMDPNMRTDSRFPFMFIELKFDAEGKRTGRVYPQADIRLTNEGVMEIASFSSPPIPLYDVSALK